MKCKNCDNILIDSDQFCTKCGFRMEKKEADSAAKDAVKYKSEFGGAVLNFMRLNWFKLCILILITVFVVLLVNNGIKISVRHSGSIDLDLSGDVDTNIDGATLWLE